MIVFAKLKISDLQTWKNNQSRASDADALATNSVNHELGFIAFDHPPNHAAQAFLDDIAAVSRARMSSSSNF